MSAYRATLTLPGARSQTRVLPTAAAAWRWLGTLPEVVGALGWVGVLAAHAERDEPGEAGPFSVLPSAATPDTDDEAVTL